MKNTFVRTLRKLALPLSIAVASLVAPYAAKAGTITGVGSISGTGLGSVVVPVINTFAEGNDNQTGGGEFDVNQIVPVKRFDHTGNIDIQFNVRDSRTAGTTEYAFFESVDNNTGINWSSYSMELGFGVGANFQPSLAGDGLDFDAPGYDSPPTSSAFFNVALAEDILLFSVGFQSTGAEIYQFRIDVPDGITSFTLRQTPTNIKVPEPSTLVLAGCAMIGLIAVKRRRRS